eukprot:TRINITY_DN3707_c0_g1_i3.p1 TRINITY_DN3707_c0_g1~~TRINITY_DN3707_c0_g1_i3.p1  ORF type:complete len:457 (+),score=101.72 TRINITY_DN3707_c0_g1_i3:664-2034(+)
MSPTTLLRLEFNRLGEKLQDLAQKIDDTLQKDKKQKRNLCNFSLCCILVLCIKFLYKWQLLANFEDLFKTSLSFLDVCTLQHLDEFVDEISQLINSTSSSEGTNIRAIEYVLMIIDKFASILASKNLSNDEIKNCSMKLSTLITAFLIRISTVSDEHLYDAVKLALECHDKYASSDLFRKLNLVPSLNQAFVSFIFSISKTLNIINMESEDKNRILLLILDFIVRMFERKGVQDTQLTMKLLQKIFFEIKYEKLDLQSSKGVFSQLHKLSNQIKSTKDESVCITFIQLETKLFLLVLDHILKENLVHEIWYSTLESCADFIQYGTTSNLLSLHEISLEGLKNILRVLSATNILQLEPPAQVPTPANEGVPPAIVVRGGSPDDKKNHDEMRVKSLEILKKHNIDVRVLLDVQNAQTIFLYKFIINSVCPVSYTHLRAHETDSYLVCRLLLEKKKLIN